jgi:hypothetical protein
MTTDILKFADLGPSSSCRTVGSDEIGQQGTKPMSKGQRATLPG